jgi:hypothetical protein
LPQPGPFARYQGDTDPKAQATADELAKKKLRNRNKHEKRSTIVVPGNVKFAIRPNNYAVGIWYV